MTARGSAVRGACWRVGDLGSVGHGARGRMRPWVPGAEATGQHSWKGPRSAPGDVSMVTVTATAQTYIKRSRCRRVGISSLNNPPQQQQYYYYLHAQARKLRRAKSEHPAQSQNPHPRLQVGCLHCCPSSVVLETPARERLLSVLTAVFQDTRSLLCPGLKCLPV